MISIIIPVYNVEKDLHRCVDSILSQTYIDFELLLIDDGSRDRSGSICDDYAQKDNRIKVFHIQNGGVSNARNIGLDHATGEFVAFCDSDDWINAETFERSVLELEKEEADIVFFGITKDFVDSDGEIAYSDVTTMPAYKSFEANEMNGNFSYMMRTLNMESCDNKIYRRSIIEDHNLRFRKGIIVFEDFNFVIDYLRNIKSKVVILPQVYYHYIYPLNVNGAQRRSSVIFYNDIKFLLENLSSYLNTIGIREKDQSYFDYVFMDKLKFVFKYEIGKNGYSHAKKRFKEILKNPLFIERKDRIFTKSGYFKTIIILLRYKMYYLSYLFVKKAH